MDAQDYLQRFQRRELPILVDVPAHAPTDAPAHAPADALAHAPADAPADAQSAALFAALRARGFCPQTLTDQAYQDAAEAPSLLLMTRLQTLQKLRQWWGSCAVPVCHLAVARFDPSLASIEYALERLLQVPVEEGLTRRQRTYEQLFSSRGIELHTSAGVCRILTGDAVEVPNHGRTLEPGSVYSITEFLEASMVNLEGETSSFSVEGILAFDGMNVLYNRPDQQAEFGEPLARFLTLASRGNNTVRLEANRITELRLNGEDCTTELQDLMGERERGTHITEFGIGCAQYLSVPDFSINALVNKVTAGAYLGIGMGWQFPHLDFIVRNVSLRYLS